MTNQKLLSLLLIASLSGCAVSGRPFFSRKADNTLERSISIARLTERHGNVQQARTMYTRIASEHPNHPAAHHRLGVLAGKAGNYQEALNHLARARQVGGNTSELLCDTGYLHYLQNNHAAAEEHFRAAIAADPHHKRAQNMLGLVLAEEGRFNEALVSFRRAVSEAEALSNLAYVQVQLGAFEDAEANYHSALALNQSLKPAAEGLVKMAAMQGNLHPIRTKPNSKEAIARRARGPAAEGDRAGENSGEEHTRSAQLASFGGETRSTASSPPSRAARTSHGTDDAIVRQTSHQRTHTNEPQSLVDPRVRTTSRQVDSAASMQQPQFVAQPTASRWSPTTAKQNPHGANGDTGFSSTPTTDPTAGCLPNRNPSWSANQAAPLIP